MYSVNLINGQITVPLNSGITAGKITKAVNAFDAFTATLLHGAQGYDLINPLTSHIQILKENGSEAFYGRVLTTSPRMEATGACSMEIVCEGQLAYLCDSIQPYTAERQYSGDDTKNGLQEFIDLLLANHNAQVEDYKKIYRGEVTVTTYDSSEGVYKGLNYETTWDALNDKLIKVFGGEMRVRKTDGLLYLDYKPKLGTTRATAITVGNNMQSATKKVDATQVVSRLIPLGAKLKTTKVDEQGNETTVETEERLTIAEVNSGKIYVESETAKDLYGVQYKTVIFDDIHDPQILLNRGTSYLAEQNTAIATHSVTAVDMSYLGENVDEIELFDSYPVINQYIGFSATLEVVGKVTDIFKPYNPSFTFGTQNVNLADILAGTNAQLTAVEQNSEKKNTETNNAVNNVYTYINSTATSLQGNAETLVATVTANTVAKSEYDTFSETVRNILQMDANGTSMIFQSIYDEIKKVDDAQQSNYSEILKYIRFEDGNIILGEVGNPITLTLENDILAFKQNGITIAFLSDSRFQVTDGYFSNSLRIGKFIFVPRANGNLSLVKVGEDT